MSSSDPPQLRLSLPQSASTFKRSFEQFGFDLETTVDSTVVASSSGTDEHRPGPSNGDRNKRARSSSVTPNSAEQARSMDSSPSSSSSHTISSASSNHTGINHRDAPPATAQTRHPQALENDSLFSPNSVGEPSLPSSALFDARPPESSPVEPPTSSAWSNPPSLINSSSQHNEQFRLSMERFHAFDSQISTIRARPAPLPFHIPPSSPTLPPLTLSSPVEHSHPHSRLNSAVSLPSVESLSYTSTSTSSQTPASVPPPPAPPSIPTPSDQYHSDMASIGLEEFREFRDMMGFPERHISSSSMDRLPVRPHHQSPSLLESERPQVGRPFRCPPSRHIPENISRNSTLQQWSSDRRGATLGDSDDEFGGRPIVTNLQGRRSLDLPRPRLDSSLLANRLRRSMQSQAIHPTSGRASPPRFPPSQIEPNSTQSVNNSRTQESERVNRHEPWSSQPPPRRPILAGAFRTLAERLGRGRQRTNHTADSGAERSRSPAAGVPPSPTSPTYDDWVFASPDFSSPEDISYGLDLPMPSHWLDDEIPYSRLSIPSSRIFRDTAVSGQAPWRSSIPSNDTPEDRILSLLHRPSATIQSDDSTQSDSVWRRLSYPDYIPPHLPPARTGNSRSDGTIDAPSTRATRPPESSNIDAGASVSEVTTGWRRSSARAEPNYELVHGRDAGPGPMTTASLGDRPRTDRSSVSMRELIDRHLHLQQPSRIPPNDTSTRRSSEVYRLVQPPEVGNAAAFDADAFRPDVLPDVPFSSQAAAFFASRPPSSTVESASLRHPDTIGPDHISAPSMFSWTSRFEEDFAAMSASRLRAMVEERRHRMSPEPDRPSMIRRPVEEQPIPSASTSRPLDLEDFQHGPFRATLERVERQERRQEQQRMMERQAEIDRLRSRLNELQSLDRSVNSTRVPSLPPLRLDRDVSVLEAPHRMPSPTPSANIETPYFRSDLETMHRPRSGQRGRVARPAWLDEPAPWRNSSGISSSTFPHPIPRAHSPTRPLPESRGVRPVSERERRSRPETLELWSPGDLDDPFSSLATSPTGDGGFLARSLARMRGDLPNTDRQQQRREPRGHSSWNFDPGRSTSREPHADALRGIRPLWATHTLGPWGTGTESREETLAGGSNVLTPADAIPRGRRRRTNQSALPSSPGRNGSEEERPSTARRASSTSRYAAARRAIRDPIFDRVQRMVRGSPREGGFFGRYPRRNPGDFIRDEDFDSSYESLLSLAATIGEVRPRHTPDHVIEALPSSTFKVWRNAESDQRCPICLDDYQEDDPVMKLSDCSHWLHKNCLQQWLKGATTCPVCRERVRAPQSARRDRGAQVDPQPGSIRAAERNALDIVREIREQVRMALPDMAPGGPRSEAGPSNRGRSQIEREIDEEETMPQEETMSFDWEISDAI